MSVPNMRGGLFDSYVLLEKGVVFNNLYISFTVIKERKPEEEKQAMIVLRNQVDNMELKGCIAYIQEPWVDILERSTNVHEKGNHPPSQQEMQNATRGFTYNLNLWGKNEN